MSLKERNLTCQSGGHGPWWLMGCWKSVLLCVMCQAFEGPGVLAIVWVAMQEHSAVPKAPVWPLT
jgi:hypothetical protein